MYKAIKKIRAKKGKKWKRIKIIEEEIKKLEELHQKVRYKVIGSAMLE